MPESDYRREMHSAMREQEEQESLPPAYRSGPPPLLSSLMAHIVMDWQDKQEQEYKTASMDRERAYYHRLAANAKLAAHQAALEEESDREWQKQLAKVEEMSDEDQMWERAEWGHDGHCPICGVPKGTPHRMD